MRTKVGRLVASVIATAAMIGALSACSSQSESADGSSACSPAPKGTKVVLKDSWWAPGFDKVVDLWNQKHPDIQVQYSNVPNGASGTYTNYLNALQSHTADDILSIEYEQLPTFRAANGLRNIYDCAGVPQAQKKFAPGVQSLTNFGDSKSVYGMAVDIAPTALYYRKDLFEKAGLTVPKTWDEYLADAAKIKASGGYITDLSAAGQNWWPGMVLQNGGRWFRDNGSNWNVSLDSAKSLQVADYWQKLIDQKLVLTEPFATDTWNKAVNSGQVWTVIGATWTSNTIATGAPDTSGKWALAPLPTFDGKPAAGLWGGVSFAVSKDSKHPYEAAQFASWVATDPEALALGVKDAGLFPPSSDALTAVPSLSEPSTFFGGQRILQDFGKNILPTVPSGWQWGPAMVKTYDSLQTEVGKALSGGQTLGQAFKQTQAATISAMKAQSIPVAK